jgi:hypothetical protein
MLKDKNLELAKEQAVTVSAATTNHINAKKGGDAVGEELYVVAQVKAAVQAAGAATVEFKLETADTADFLTGLKTLYSSGPIGKADLTAGKEMAKFRMPLGLKQFTRGYFAVGTGPLTAGTFDVFMTPAVDHK